MIHEVRLPEQTNKMLMEVVELQLSLLQYAAARDLIDQVSCADYLNNIRARRLRLLTAGRSEKIAKWIWKSEKRHKPLALFATGSCKEKYALLDRILVELHLFESGSGQMMPLAIPKTQPEWQTGAWKFFQQFYDELDYRLPAYLFSPPNKIRLRKRDLLRAFQKKNRKLHYCAACDESPYYSGKRTIFDHYFPKSLYPHLSCHPFNLIAICYFCNHKKHNVDPLKGRSGRRLDLEEILQPYHEIGLGIRTYLEVRIQKAGTQFGELKPRRGESLAQRIEVLADLYDIPNRWTDKIDEIEDSLFRQIRQVLRDPLFIPPRISVEQAILHLLDWLFNDSLKNQGKEKLGFAFTWYLAARINQEVEPYVLSASPAPSALLQEIHSWIERGDLTIMISPAAEKGFAQYTERVRDIRREAVG